MSSWPESRLAAAALIVIGAIGIFGPALAQPSPGTHPASYPGIGRPATGKEIAAWDIDVRPDFKGLPKGAGSAEKGMQIWEDQCASCHGVFGESNQFFSPLVGGTTAQDIRSGHAARLNDPAYPGRTTMMKLPTVSTLWDYIRRAMPWTAPKSLSVDEVYAVTAYLLSMAEVVPEDFVLSDANIAQVQQRLPNRLGMSTEHHLWPGKGMGGKPADVKSTACMRDCAGEPKVASFLPDFARNAHGNLAEQNRMVGSQVGTDTTRPADAPHERPAAPTAPTAPTAPGAEGRAPLALLNQHACTACHALDKPLIGPAYAEIARKYAARSDREAYLAGRISAGGSGSWGAVPMPAQNLPAADLAAIAGWLAAGAPR